MEDKARKKRQAGNHMNILASVYVHTFGYAVYMIMTMYFYATPAASEIIFLDFDPRLSDWA